MQKLESGPVRVIHTVELDKHRVIYLDVPGHVGPFPVVATTAAGIKVQIADVTGLFAKSIAEELARLYWF